MIKGLKIAIILVMFPVLTAGRASAAVLSENFLKEEIIKSIKSQLGKITDSEMTVNVIQMPFKSLKVTDGKVTVNADINAGSFTSRALAKVSICVNGKNERNFGIPIEITAQDYVWVTTEQIRKGCAFTSGNLKLEKRDISSCLRFSANKNFDFSNHIAQKNFNTGEILDKRFIESTPDVLKNNIVTITFESDSISMTMDAQALESGKIGDYIKVKNKKYGKLYQGQITGTNQVLVKI
jgi:flagella basal body P-ring formation protein FlgA